MSSVGCLAWAEWKVVFSLLSVNMFFHIPFFLYSCCSSHSLFLSFFALMSICTSVMVTSPLVSHVTFLYLYVFRTISFSFYSTCHFLNAPAVPQQWVCLGNSSWAETRNPFVLVRASSGLRDSELGWTCVDAPILVPERCLFNRVLCNDLSRRNSRFQQRSRTNEFTINNFCMTCVGVSMGPSLDLERLSISEVSFPSLPLALVTGNQCFFLWEEHPPAPFGVENGVNIFPRHACTCQPDCTLL
jgi:hypothetical protein